MRGSIPVRRLQQIHHLPLRIHREPFLGHRGAGYGRSRHPASRDTRTSLYVVPAQPLAHLALARLTAHAGVQGEPVRLCHPLVARLLTCERPDRAQHQRLAPGLRPHRDAVGHRAADELPHRIRVLPGRQVQPRTLRIALQQSHALQRPTQPRGDLLHQVLELFPLRGLHPREAQPTVGTRCVHAVQTRSLAVLVECPFETVRPSNACARRSSLAFGRTC